MQHRRGAEAGSEICRAGCQVAQSRIKRVVHLLLKHAVQFRKSLVGLRELQAGADRLHAEMILLVEHDGKTLPPLDDRTGAIATGGVFAGNEMPLHQHLFLDGVQLSKFPGKRILHRRQSLDSRAQDLQCLGSLAFFRPTRKRVAAQISRQTDAGSDHGRLLGSTSRHPVRRVADESGETHHFPTSVSVSA